jgi:hypothetical protein
LVVEEVPKGDCERWDLAPEGKEDVEAWVDGIEALRVGDVCLEEGPDGGI